MIWLLALLPLQDSWLSTFQSAEAQLAAGDVSEARASLERCLELVPRNPTTAYHLAIALGRAGSLDEAREWLERAVDWGWRDGAVLRWDPELAAIANLEQLAAAADAAPPNDGAVHAEIAFVHGWGHFDGPGPPEHPIVDLGHGRRGVLDAQAGAVRGVVADGEWLGYDPRDDRWIHLRPAANGTQLLDLTQGEVVLTIEGPTRVLELYPAAGGRWAALVQNGDQSWVQIHRADGTLEPGVMARGAGKLRVSHDGRRAWAIEVLPPRARYLDLEHGKELRVPFPRAMQAGFLDEKTAWVLYRGSRLFIVDAETGKSIRILPETQGAAFPPFFTDAERGGFVCVSGRRMRVIAPDGSILEEQSVESMTRQDWIRLRDAGARFPRYMPRKQQATVESIPGELDEVLAPLPWPSNDRVAVLLRSGYVRLVDLETGRRLQPDFERVEGVRKLVVARDGTRLAGYLDGWFVLWDLETGASLGIFEELGSLAPDLDAVFVPIGDTLVRRELPSGDERFRYEAASMEWTLRGRLFSVSEDGTLVAMVDEDQVGWVLDALTGDVVAHCPVPAEYLPRWIAVDNTGSRLFACWEDGGEEDMIVDLRKETYVYVDYPSLGKAVDRAFFTEDGSALICLTSDWTDLYVLDTETGRASWWKWPGAQSGNVQMRLRGPRLFTGTIVFDVSSGETLLEPHDLAHVDGTQDGRWVFGVRDGLVVKDGGHPGFPDRYEYIEIVDRGALLHLPNLLYVGDGPAIAAGTLIVGGDSAPLDQFAPLLYAPRRVAAALAGVEVRAPDLRVK